MGIVKNGALLFILSLLSTFVKVQDTLKINNLQADSIFLKNSFKSLKHTLC